MFVGGIVVDEFVVFRAVTEAVLLTLFVVSSVVGVSVVFV